MLNKKKITKMLNPGFRKNILGSITGKYLEQKKITSYARYVVDTQIIHRSKKYENDKSAYYGFSPIHPLCAVLNDGNIDKKFFEFNIVNHFLRNKDGDSAVEVVQCILILWCKTDKNIKDFDIDLIDAELVKIEREYLAKQKEEKEKEEKEKTEKLLKENTDETEEKNNNDI